MGASAVLFSAILITVFGHQLSYGHHGREIASLTFTGLGSASDGLVATRDAAGARYDPDRQNGYHLFTRENPTVSQPLVRDNVGVLSASNYNNQRRTALLLHGWGASATSEFNTVLVPALLTAEDLNVVVVDWGAGAVDDRNNTVLSGESVARFMNWLLPASGSAVDQLFIIGFSISGHQAGIVARNINGTVPHIIALDPANRFHGTPNRLQITDATYIESMFTNAGEVGDLGPLGHVSFYPNGGINMPGCADTTCDHLRYQLPTSNSVLTPTNKMADNIRDTVEHIHYQHLTRSSISICYFYLAESVVTGGFTGRRCDTLDHALNGTCDSDDYLPMGGIYTKFGFTGIYYLETNAGPPFSKG